MLKRSKFQFENPVLKKMQFSTNEKFEKENYAGMRLSGKTKVWRKKGEDSAIVNFNLMVGDHTNASPFFIDVEMSAVFVWEDELDEEMVGKLLRMNAPSLLLGYIRPIVAEMTGASEYPAFNLPFLDMQENEAVFEEI